MKKVLGVLSCCFLFSCGDSNTVEISKEEYAELRGESPYIYSAKLGGFDVDFKIVEIDSCEYLYAWESNNSTVLTHKGNCKFCAKRKLK